MVKIRTEFQINQRISMLQQKIDKTMNFHDINIYMAKITELKWVLGEEVDNDEENN